MKQYRILHIVGSMNRGGIETWLMHVLRHIDRQQYHMDFLVHTDQPGAYDDEVRELGSNIISCPLDRKRPWLYASRFKRILRECGPYDVVHSHAYFFTGFILSLTTYVPHLFRISHIYPPSDKKKQTFQRIAYRKIATFLISRHADILLFDSQHSRDSFQCLCPHIPKSVVYCGIDLMPYQKTISRGDVRRSLRIPEDKPLITYVARFFPHKNHAQMVRIADMLNKDGYHYHFAMVGSHGPLLEQFEHIAKQRQDMSFFKSLQDISSLLLASDIFFFPSLHEGFGIVAVEASAAGLPVVATDLLSIREACSPTNQALMFPPNNDEIACKHIVKILSNDELKQKISLEAISWAQKFSITNSVTELIAMYQKASG